MENASTKLAMYIRGNWFKLALAALLAFVAFKKDLSFNIRLNSPAHQESPQIQKPVHQEHKKESERLTDATSPAQESARTIDRLDISSLLGGAAPSLEDRLEQADPAIVKTYISRFTHVAKSEQRKYGIPACVILAGALLQSEAGQNELALKGNNQFGLPCTSDWQGETIQYKGNCYRKYENAWTSFRDFSLYLSTGAIGQNILKLHPENCRDWAKAVTKADIFLEKDIPDQIMQVITRYQLDQQ